MLRNGSILLDDPLYVFENPHVNRGFTAGSARWILTQPLNGNWHPLTSLSHLLDVQLFGLNPAAHHATSVVLHVVNALLLLLVLSRLTGAWWRSALVAGLFALHPLRAESVAWISERKDVLSGLFFLLTIDAYRRWVERPDRARYAWVIAALALGLMSKPMLVTLPCVLVLLDVWPLGRLAGAQAVRAGRAPVRTLGGLIAEKWPLFALSGLVALVTFLVQRRAGAVASTLATPIAQRACNALISYWRYIAKTFWPVALAPFSPPPRGANLAGALLAAAGLAGVTALALRQARRRPYLPVGWLWYVGMLVPVIGLIQVGMQSYADRYTYLPTIGLTIAMVWGVSEVARAPLARHAAVVASLLALTGLAVATTRQVARWKDTRTLFTYTLAVTRDNAAAHQNLGNALMLAGDPRGAIPHFQEALRLEPEFPNTRTDLGSALGMAARYDEALVQFQAALRQHETADIHYDLGLVYARQGRTSEAIRECEAALRLEPNHYGAHAQLGLAYGAGGQLDRALEHLGRASALKPGPEIERTLAATYARAGRFPEALAAIERALALASAAGASEQVARCIEERERYRRGEPLDAGP